MTNGCRFLHYQTVLYILASKTRVWGFDCGQRTGLQPSSIGSTQTSRPFTFLILCTFTFEFAIHTRVLLI